MDHLSLPQHTLSSSGLAAGADVNHFDKNYVRTKTTCLFVFAMFWCSSQFSIEMLHINSSLLAFLYAIVQLRFSHTAVCQISVGQPYFALDLQTAEVWCGIFSAPLAVAQHFFSYFNICSQRAGIMLRNELGPIWAEVSLMQQLEANVLCLRGH
jgi:hypothetical protein